MKSQLAIFHFSLTTKELCTVSLCEQKTTTEEAQKTCDALNPNDPKLIRYRVGMLVWKE